MGTHPIFESDFDCLTENNNFPSVKFERNEDALDSAFYGIMPTVPGIRFHRNRSRTKIRVAIWCRTECNNRPDPTVFIYTNSWYINNQTLCNPRTTRTLPWKHFNRFEFNQTKNWIKLAGWFCSKFPVLAKTPADSINFSSKF